MFDPEDFRLKLAKQLRALEAALGQLASALTHENVAVQVLDTPTARVSSTKVALRQVIEAYTKIRYDMEDATNESPVCVGVVAAPAAVVSQATRVNELKSELAALCAPLRLKQVRVPVRIGEKSTEKISVVRAALRSLQASDVNLMAAYRRIPILTVPPESVRFTRARTRSVYRKTVDEIYTLLEGKDGPQATADRARLDALPREVTHLALVGEHYENVRANVVYRHLDKRGRGRVQFAAELPLLFRTQRGGFVPEVSFPAEVDTDATPRKPRSSKLEAQSFLQSVAVYRYREGEGVGDNGKKGGR